MRVVFGVLGACNSVRLLILCDVLVRVCYALIASWGCCRF